MSRSRLTVRVLAGLILVLAAGATSAGSAVLDRDPRNTHEERSGPSISSSFPSYAFISNGTLRLGITPQGYIDATDGTENVGLVYLPTGGDALIPGCWCEGWGLADTAAQVSGWASGASSNGGISANVNVVGFDVTSQTAESTVEIAGRLRVRHLYRPSSRPALYQVDLRVENIGTTSAPLVYRRAMDWDVPPTEFDEFVTLQGTHPQLLDSTDDGFAHVDPLRPLTDLGARGTFTDVGPDDRGGAFDLSLGTLAPGASTTLTMFYGASGTEVDALAALSAVGASIYSLGQPNTPDGPTLGTPNTFMFGIPSGGTPPPGSAPPGSQTFGVGEDGVGTHGRCGCRLLADPVNSVTGAFTTQVEDLMLPGTGMSLDWRRSYTSADPTIGRLGPGWTDSYSASLALEPDGDVVLHGEDGQQLVYALQGDGSFVGAPGSRSTLSSVTGGYELVRHDQVRYRFDSQGRLLSMKDRNGQGLTLAYDGSGRLVTITDAAGRQASLAYNASGLVSQVSTQDGRSVSYGYTSGRLTSVTDVRGKQWTYTYDAGGRLATIRDPLNHTQVTNVYGADGRVASQTDALGKQTTFAWDATSEVATATDANGKAWKHDYEGGVIAREIDPLNNETQLAHDAGLNEAAVTGPTGEQTTMTYDAAGNLLTATAPASLGSVQKRFVYNARNDPTQVTDARGKVTSYAYDASGNVSTVTQDGVQVASYTYDAAGRVLTSTDGRGKTTTYTYDASGNVASVADPLGNRTTYTYDGAGRVLTRVDPKGNVQGANPADFHWSYTYDAAGNLLTETDPLGNATVNTYDPVGNLASVRDANQRTTSYSYDAAGRILTVTAPDGGITTYAYDPAGNVLSRTDANAHTTTYAYDDAGRLVSETSPDPDGPGPEGPAVTTYAYDANGNRVTLTDPNGNATATAGDGTTTYGYDRANRLVSIDYSDSTPDVAFTYDAVGNRLTMTDGQGTETRTYDGLDRLLSVARGSDTFSYLYDPVGNITRRTYPGGQAADYAYDPLNRLTSVQSGGLTTSYAYDAASNLTKSTLPASNGYAETRLYDRAGRLVEVRTDRPSQVTGSEPEIPQASLQQTQFNGSVTDIDEDPDAPDSLWMTATGANPSVRVSFATPSYAISGQQTFKARVRRQSGGSGTRTARIDLYEAGTLKATGTAHTITSTSGQTITQTFNVDSLSLADRSGAGIEARLVGATTQGNKSIDLGALRWTAGYVLSPQTLARFVYTLDPVGNPTQVVRTGALAQTQTYSYDASDRLAAVCFQAGSCPGASDPFLRYTYDRVGNRLSEQRPGETTTYTYDARDRLLEASGGLSSPISYGYDRNGNLVSAFQSTLEADTTVLFGYDLANRLVSHSTFTTVPPPPCDPIICVAGGPQLPGGDGAYAYDGEGKRVQASADGASTRSLWDVSHPLPQLALERDGQGQLLRRYLYGAGRVSQTSGAGTFYFHGDQLGSVSSLTSAAGGHEQSFAYQPFGSLQSELPHAASPPASVFRFTGEQLDPSGLYHLRARQYDPSVGRFLSPDPIGQSPNQMEISPYAYVANRPTVMVDPSGATFRPSAHAETVARLAASIRLLIGDTADSFTALSPLTDEALTSHSFRVRSCLFVAQLPNWTNEPGFFAPKRTGTGVATVSCSRQSQVWFRVCTQKQRSVFVADERCRKYSARIPASDSITRLGPTLETRVPCPFETWHSRVTTQTQSATSAAGGSRFRC